MSTTFFSGETIGYWSSTTNYMYGTLTGNVTRSGNTVTLSGMSLSITSRYASYGTSSFTFTVNGTATSTTLSAPPTSMSINSTSFSVGVSDTSRSVSWSTSDGYSGSFTVTFASGVVAPTKPTISVAQNDRQSNIITYGTTSFGSPTTGTVYLYGGTTSSPTTQVSAKTSTGSSSFTHTGLESNTTYYYRARAYNGYAWSSYSNTVSVTTKPAVYVSESGLSRATQKLYASVNGQSKQVLKLYDSNNGVSRRIY